MLCDTLPRLEAGEYPGGIWYYEPHTYQPYRYVPVSYTHLTLPTIYSV